MSPSIMGLTTQGAHIYSQKEELNQDLQNLL